jgi:hypothetical protein
MTHDKIRMAERAADEHAYDHSSRVGEQLVIGSIAAQ